MMKEILITSSALILALLVIRQAFRGVLSRRFQYALWALVLVRLLVPVSLPAADFSLMTAAQPVQAAVAERINQPLYFRPQGQVSREELVERNIDPEDVPTPQDLFVLGESDPDNRYSTNWLVRDPESGAVTRYAEMTVGPWDLLDRVWKAGMVLMGGFFLFSNLGFYWRLRKNRREWRDEVITPYGTPTAVGPDDPSGRSPRKVYLVPDGVIPSPCLFGRSIYITPAVAADENKLRHVLCHEETHARHWDPLWSLLRCLCLTVYWFDPLVWIAAACSKTDCELACDESVLNILGERERIPYGQTLVSLIPVKRAGNPMIAATTMTAGKKQLRDRVTRIARRPRQLMAAALAVAVLAGIISACTFTGGTSGESATPELSNPSQGPTESTLRSLTGEELRWFNEEFFNCNPNPVISYTYSIRNQFINAAFNLYDRPEDIDLYQLFYCDGSILSDEEYRAVYGGEEMPCPAFKLTAEEMDGILQEYTGLTLAQTNMVGIENFTYQDGAYYWEHGDTNYPGNIEILCGTREGSTVKLYHHGWSSGSEWYCTTLEAQSGGGYWFKSNRESETPAIPTPLPAWERSAAIDLSSLDSYTPPAVSMERHEGDFVFSSENNIANWNFSGHHVRVYRSTDGAVYAAEELEDGAMNVFAQYSFDDVELFFFNDLFGRDGFTVTYRPGANSRFYETDTDYFYFEEDGMLVLLATCHGESEIIDLDGDGQNELVAPRQLFFQRDGVVCEAQLDELLLNACPELSYWDHESWDKYSKCLQVHGYTEDYKEWTRYLYFDGEKLLVYKNEKPTEDHMVVGADAGVPEAVVKEARSYVQRVYTASQTPTAEEYAQAWEDPASWDDWRLDYFDGPYTYSHGGATVEGWQFNYEMHTTTPENIVLAGGKYITEDDWVSPGYPGCDTLFFVVENGEYRFLDRRMVQEGMYSYYIDGVVLGRMEARGVELPDGSTYAQLNFQKYLGHLTDYAETVRVQYDDGQGGGGAYLIHPSEGNGPYYLGQMTDNSVVWSWAQAPAADPQGPSVTLSTEDWYETLRFWRVSGLVMYKQENRDPRWFQVQYDGDPAVDVFSYRAVPYYWARCWFDSAEWGAMEGSLPLIPDGGQSRLNIAREWADAHEGLMTRLSPGGSTTCTYVRVTDVEIWEDQPKTWFPADIVDYPHFCFSYRVIFVPENQDALNTLMAGNTGNYEGGDPDVPQGAFEYSRMGAMYLKDGYWYCAGVGTG